MTAPGQYPSTNASRASSRSLRRAALAWAALTTCLATHALTPPPPPSMVLVVDPVVPIAGQPAAINAVVIGADEAVNLTLFANARPIPGCGSLRPRATDTPLRFVATCNHVFSADERMLQGVVAFGQRIAGGGGVADGFLRAELPIRPAAATLRDVGGLWSGRAGNGWGMTISQHGASLFIALFVYDAGGAPTWYVMPAGAWRDAATFSGELYQPRSSPFDRYDSAAFAAGASVGRADIVFDGSTALLRYSIGGITGERRVDRSVFGTADPGARFPIADLWWGAAANPREDGWGVSIIQQGDRVFAGWFTYGADGRPRWFVMPGATWTGTQFRGDLFATTSSAWLGVDYDPSRLALRRVGTLHVTFGDPYQALMTYDVDSVLQSKNLRRQPF